MRSCYWFKTGTYGHNVHNAFSVGTRVTYRPPALGLHFRSRILDECKVSVNLLSDWIHPHRIHWDYDNKSTWMLLWPMCLIEAVTNTFHFTGYTRPVLYSLCIRHKCTGSQCQEGQGTSMLRWKRSSWTEEHVNGGTATVFTQKAFGFPAPLGCMLDHTTSSTFE